MKKASFFALVIVLLFFCCQTPSLMQKLQDRADYPALEKAFKAIDNSPGSREASLTTSDGNRWDFQVHFPQKASDELLPLVIGLHWAGPKGSYREYAGCLAEPGLEELGAIIISPEANQQLWSTEFNQEKVLSLLALARVHWPVDTTQIFITGYSNGGNGSWFFAEKYPKLFTAAIPMASAYQAIGKVKIPLYVIHGEKDELFLLDNTQGAVQSARDAGTDITFKVVPDFTHYMACSYVDALREAVAWLNIKKD